jgi:hypothetical protein
MRRPASPAAQLATLGHLAKVNRPATEHQRERRNLNTRTIHYGDRIIAAAI